MKNYFAALVAFFIFTGGIPLSGYAAEKAVSVTPHIEMLDDATMEKFVELSEPSEQHRMLSTLAGAWYYEVKYWTKENDEPQISSGILTNEMILGDRFLSSKLSLILNVGGQSIPYEAWGILGFDTIKNTFTSVWVDTMHSGIMIGAGQYNEQKNAIEEKGHFTHPLLEKEQAYRSELQFINDEEYKRSIFIAEKSKKEFKVLEIDFQRR